jgi:hypothetical protein
MPTYACCGFDFFIRKHTDIYIMLNFHFPCKKSYRRSKIVKPSRAFLSSRRRCSAAQRSAHRHPPRRLTSTKCFASPSRTIHRFWTLGGGTHGVPLLPLLSPPLLLLLGPPPRGHAIFGRPAPRPRPTSSSRDSPPPPPRSCGNPPKKIPYYRLNQSTLVIKR